MDERARQALIRMGMYPIFPQSSPEMIEMLDQFNQIDIRFQDFYDWIELACSINGYKLLDELGIEEDDVWNWYSEKYDIYEKNQHWGLPLVELMILLFLHYRRWRFVSGGQEYDFINSLLIEISEKTNNLYQPEEQDREWLDEHNREEVKSDFPVISSQNNDEESKTADADNT